MIENYDLERDLDAVQRALHSDMPEAVVFYCGRALEATAARAVAALNLDPGAQVFSNLDMLERLSCISRPALYLGMRCAVSPTMRATSCARCRKTMPNSPPSASAPGCNGIWRIISAVRVKRCLTKASASPPRSPPAMSPPRLICCADRTPAARTSRTSFWGRFDPSVAKLPALSSMIAESLISCGRAGSR